jgi:hypothetical protein
MQISFVVVNLTLLCFSECEEERKSTNDMHLFGRHGGSSRQETTTPKRRATFFSRVFGLVLIYPEVSRVDSNVLDFGKRGESWKRKRATMLLLDGASAVP